MKTITKIALTFILLTCFSISAYAAGGDILTIDGSNSDGPDLAFTPSGNTLMVAATTENEYYIGSASEKTTAGNGLEFCMVSGYSGYYQTVQSVDDTTKKGTISAAGTAGSAPDWTAMGGAEEEEEKED